MKTPAVKGLFFAVAAMCAAVAGAETKIDPAVGWEKDVAVGSRVIHVVAFTNTADTYTYQLPDSVQVIDYLVVGGGGGGGGGWGGGGGAGGMIYKKDQAVSGTLSVKVGAGGPGASGYDVNGSAGEDSTLTGTNFSETAKGGGYGGYFRISGGSGGSGGGSGGTGISKTADCSGGAGTSDQGHAGGSMSSAIGYNQCGGGGGGAGALGQNCDLYNTAESGGGGDGLPCSITGEEVWYAGGGGGGTADAAYLRKGGKGGGGDGGTSSRISGLPGIDGLGGGGGGGYANISNQNGGRGGSGIVVLAWQVSGKERNEWTADASISRAAWYEGESATITPPVARYGADTMTAAIARNGGTPTAWDGKMPTVAGSYVITWTVPETDEREVLETGLSFAIMSLDETRQIDPSVGWAKKIRVNGKSYVLRAYTNVTDSYRFQLPDFVRAIDCLVVGGGGGGGGDSWGGGGGAGGMIYREGVSAHGWLTVVVGRGGAKRSSGNGSSLKGEGLSVVAAGGGNGGTLRDSGGSGGSGGGSGGTGISEIAGCSGGAGTSDQGHAGGSMSSAIGYNQCGGGGGGAGAPGQDAGLYAAEGTGGGGDGLACSITGEEVWYAGGGGGGTAANTYQRAGGKGGGGAGAMTGANRAKPGVDGLGGGGGGASAAIRADDSGKGGNGIVIFRFALPVRGSVLFVR